MLRRFVAAIAMLVVGAGAAFADTPFKGEVLEVKDVDTYTYLRLKTKDGETWAAVNKVPIKKGALVTIENPTVMRNFESKTLKRKFDTIVFGTVAGTGGASSAGGAGGPAAPAAADLGQIHGGMSKSVDVGDVKVPKATGPGARTVAEIVGKAAELKDKPVLVRGKVVKFTPEVMGKNWIHLRDGSGSAADNTNDILVTSKDSTAVGDVVVAKGVVRTDVNLGSGYSYKVLVEEATLQK